MLQATSQAFATDLWGAPVQIDSRLVEQAVLVAIDTEPAAERRAFRAERDPIYDLDPAKREARFEELHARWFERLGLAEALLALLGEQPSIAGSVAACLVVPAARRKDEHADLRETRDSAHGAGDAAPRRQRPHLVVRVLAATLVDHHGLERLLRRELIYVADMLDPTFGYDPATAVRETSGPLASLVRERHELLWQVSVDGRLAARGHLTEADVQALRGRFQMTFGLFGPSGDAAFETLFRGPRLTHRELMALARHPAGEGQGPSGQCPLCGMPAPREQLERERLSTRAIAALRRDFADWQPSDGICSHCADLYELRERTRTAVRLQGHAERRS